MTENGLTTHEWAVLNLNLMALEKSRDHQLFKFRASFNNDLSWARQVTQDSFAVADTISGVNMRLIPKNKPEVMPE